jgi:predicted ATP-dependent endonuclease of OLD family
MEENFNNKISRLELENFTCFAKAEMDFSSGINVFIGENGTGKTHILKAMLLHAS